MFKAIFFSLLPTFPIEYYGLLLEHNHALLVNGVGASPQYTKKMIFSLIWLIMHNTSLFSAAVSIGPIIVITQPAPKEGARRALFHSF